MENKTEAVRREILKGILERHSGKGQRILIKKCKEQGVYKQFVDDIEIWDLIQKFAKFHNIQIIEPQSIEKPIIPEKVLEIVEVKKNESNENSFLKLLEREHDKLSSKLLALNKVIAVYKS